MWNWIPFLIEHYNTSKNHDFYKLKYTLHGIFFHANYSFSGQLIFENNFFKDWFTINSINLTSIVTTSHFYHDFHKLETTLIDEASARISAHKQISFWKDV